MVFVSAKRQTDALLGIIVLLAFVSLLPLAIACSPIMLGYYLQRRWQKRKLIAEIRNIWLLQGKRVLFFYSNRGIWKSYFEQTFIPRLKDRAIIWNWSERHQQGWSEDLLEARVLRFLIPRKVFCPCAVLFSAKSPPQFFFFAESYTDWIKSKKPTFHEQEEGFFRALEQAS